MGQKILNKSSHNDQIVVKLFQNLRNRMPEGAKGTVILRERRDFSVFSLNKSRNFLVKVFLSALVCLRLFLVLLRQIYVKKKSSGNISIFMWS